MPLEGKDIMDLIDGGGEAGELARWDFLLEFVKRNKFFFGWTTFSQMRGNFKQDHTLCFIKSLQSVLKIEQKDGKF